MAGEKLLPDSMPPEFGCMHLHRSTKAGPKAKDFCTAPGVHNEYSHGDSSCTPGSSSFCDSGIILLSSSALTPQSVL